MAWTSLPNHMFLNIHTWCCGIIDWYLILNPWMNSSLNIWSNFEEMDLSGTLLCETSWKCADLRRGFLLKLNHFNISSTVIHQYYISFCILFGHVNLFQILCHIILSHSVPSVGLPFCTKKKQHLWRVPSTRLLAGMEVIYQTDKVSKVTNIDWTQHRKFIAGMGFFLRSWDWDFSNIPTLKKKKKNYCVLWETLPEREFAWPWLWSWPSDLYYRYYIF
jgi:hypothetical protein